MRVHRIVSWNSDDPDSVGHDNVLALPGYEETGPFQRPNRAEVRDTRYLRHALCRDFHFPQVPFPGQFFRDLQVIVDGVPYIRQCFLFGGAL